MENNKSYDEEWSEMSVVLQLLTSYGVRTDTKLPLDLLDWRDRDIKAERARLRAAVEGMKGPGLNMDTLSCLKCGGYDDCDCESKNEALDAVLKLLSEEAV